MTTVTEILKPVELDLEALLSDLRSLIGAGHPILQAAAEPIKSKTGTSKFFFITSKAIAFVVLQATKKASIF